MMMMMMMMMMNPLSHDPKKYSHAMALQGFGEERPIPLAQVTMEIQVSIPKGKFIANNIPSSGFKPCSLHKNQRTSQIISYLNAQNSALQTSCSTEQQTIQNQSAVVTNAPIQVQNQEPKLDDGGIGGGPGRGDGGGGGGGGGSGGWAGGFFFWGLLMMLGFIRDNEKDKPYKQTAQTIAKAKRRR